MLETIFVAATVATALYDIVISPLVSSIRNKTVRDQIDKITNEKRNQIEKLAKQGANLDEIKQKILDDLDHIKSSVPTIAGVTPEQIKKSEDAMEKGRLNLNERLKMIDSRIAKNSANMDKISNLNPSDPGYDIPSTESAVSNNNRIWNVLNTFKKEGK